MSANRVTVDALTDADWDGVPEGPDAIDQALQNLPVHARQEIIRAIASILKGADLASGESRRLDADDLFDLGESLEACAGGVELRRPRDAR